ncbi:MAG: hypothetical protein LDL19_07665 [Thiobacillus sp.]|nr:hypothetical protein [Thiobacillus sp.]
MRFVFFQLGSLVGGDRVLQRQRMQAELVAEPGDGLAVGRFQFDPEKAVRLADVLADVVEGNRPGLAVENEQAVDDIASGGGNCWNFNSRSKNRIYGR